MAHELGAKYAVLTANYMSGFRLWDSKGYDYDVAGEAFNPSNYPQYAISPFQLLSALHNMWRIRTTGFHRECAAFPAIEHETGILRTFPEYRAPADKGSDIIHPSICGAETNPAHPLARRTG